MKKHPTREILDAGGVVDGEAFDIMLREEREVEMKEHMYGTNEGIMKELIEIRKMLEEIKEVIVCAGPFYDDNHVKYYTIKVPVSNQ